MCGTVHVQTMEMQRRRLISKRVLDIDNDLITFVGNDRWDGPLTIDAHHGAILLAIWVCVCPSDVKVIGDSGSLRNGSKERKWKEEARQ